MEISGVQLIPAPQQRVWEALNDPEVLKACIPGCESVEKSSDTQFAMAMTAVIGPVKARFTGKLVISESNPPDRYVLSFEGSGGAAGFGKGSASVSLAPMDEGTQLSYQASVQIGGKIAQIGSRLIDGIAKKMAEDFFSRFNAHFPPSTLPRPEVAVPDCADPAIAQAAEHPGVSKQTWIWIAAGAAVSLIYLVYVRNS
jgi:uncharacterized protein